MYYCSKENVVTTHQEYGLFFKDLNAALKKRHDLYAKQKEGLLMTAGAKSGLNFPWTQKQSETSPLKEPMMATSSTSR